MVILCRALEMKLDLNGICLQLHEEVILRGAPIHSEQLEARLLGVLQHGIQHLLRLHERSRGQINSHRNTVSLQHMMPYNTICKLFNSLAQAGQVKGAQGCTGDLDHRPYYGYEQGTRVWPLHLICKIASREAHLPGNCL